MRRVDQGDVSTLATLVLKFGDSKIIRVLCPPPLSPSLPVCRLLRIRVPVASGSPGVTVTAVGLFVQHKGAIDMAVMSSRRLGSIDGTNWIATDGARAASKRKGLTERCRRLIVGLSTRRVG